MVNSSDLINFISSNQREFNVLSKTRLKDIKHQRPCIKNLKNHIDKFIDAEGEYYNRCIMLPGFRGVGKTTILYQLYNYLIDEKNISFNDIFYLDMSSLRDNYDVGIRDVFELYLENFHQTTLVNLNKKIFFFIDEAQIDKNWANYAKLLHDKSFNVFCIFTGSSAINFEINNAAARRVKYEKIYPVDFKEYLLLKHDLDIPDNNFKDLILKADRDSIDKAIEIENEIRKKLILLNNDLNIEFKKYIETFGFPFALKMDDIDVHLYTISIIKRIITDDLPLFYNFNNINLIIMKIILYLSSKKPGNTSSNAISQAMGINVKTTNKILEALENSLLLFSIGAYGSAGKMLNKPYEHFFLTPSIKASLNYYTRRFDLNNDKCFSHLVENEIASILFKLSRKTWGAVEIFYDSDKRGVDFIVKHLDKVIPIEVGIGKKTKSQLTRAINKYDADFGILISARRDNIEFVNNILYIPLLTFVLM